MAVGILGGHGLLAKQDVSDYLMVGELSLDVKLRPVKGGEPCIAEVRWGRGGRSVDGRNAPGAESHSRRPSFDNPRLDRGDSFLISAT